MVLGAEQRNVSRASASSRAAAARAGLAQQNAIARTRVGQHLAGHFLDEGGIGTVIAEEGHLPLEIAAHGLQGRELGREAQGPRFEMPARIDAMLSVHGVKPEVGRQAAANEQHR